MAQTKIVAFNLLPLTVLNGGQALVNFIKFGKPKVSWELAALKISLLTVALMVLSWGVAIVSYVL